MTPLFGMIRPGNVLIATGSVWLGGWIAGIHFFDLGLAMDGLAMGMLAAAGNLHNDIIDIEVDRVNRPARPLPSGAVSITVAGWITVLLFIVALGLGALRNWDHLNYYAGVAGVLFIYNRFLKGWPVLGNLAVAGLCASALALPMLNLDYSAEPLVLLPLVTFSFLFTWVRELVKDIEDVEGDQSIGLHTLPIVIGAEPCRVLARMLLMLANLVVAYPVVTGMYPAEFLICATLFVLPFSVIAFQALSPTNQQWRKAQSNIKRAMVGGLLASVLTFLFLPHLWALF